MRSATCVIQVCGVMGPAIYLYQPKRARAFASTIRSSSS